MPNREELGLRKGDRVRMARSVDLEKETSFGSGISQWYSLPAAGSLIEITSIESNKTRFRVLESIPNLRYLGGGNFIIDVFTQHKDGEESDVHDKYSGFYPEDYDGSKAPRLIDKRNREKIILPEEGIIHH